LPATLIHAGAAGTGDAGKGKEVYSKCKTCHGADGAGNLGMAKALNVQFKLLASPDRCRPSRTTS